MTFDAVHPADVLIIGGSGFLGSVLVKQLCEDRLAVRNADIKAPAERKELFVNADVCDRASLVNAMRGASIAYNLAAEWRDDVRPIERYYAVNVDGARNFCDAAEEVGLRKIVFVSSVSIYGLVEGITTEISEPKPFNDYGKSKLAAEKIFLEWARRDADRSLSIVRPSVIFGPGNRGNVYNLVEQIVSGGFVMIGSGANRKSMSCVENVAAFLNYCRGFGAGIRIFNYCDQPDLSMRELVTFLSSILDRPPQKRRLPKWVALGAAFVVENGTRILGRKSRITTERVRKFCANTQVSVARVRETGFTPQVTVKDGLRHLLAVDFGKVLREDGESDAIARR